jgi:hypothetical protein
MARKEDFDLALYELAIGAWEKKNVINNFYDIYDLYKGSRIENNRFESLEFFPTRLEWFLNRLWEIKLKYFDINTLSSSIEVEIQGFEDYDFDEVAVLYPNLDIVRGDKNKRPRGKDLWDTFYHFSGLDFNFKNVRKRIYVHAVSVDASCEILTRLVKHLGNNPGFQEVKIMGPGGMHRLDQIVAYFDNKESVDKALKVLGKMNDDLFAEGVPRVVKEEMKGVGIADQPPEINVLTDIPADSFGFFISQLIFLALKETSPKKEEEFLESMIDMLERAWMDPKNPHLYTHRKSVEHWFRALGLKSLEMPVRR